MTDVWRFIDSGPCKASYNMALDEAIATAVRKNDAPPTLRIYGWNVPSVSLGCFQKIRDIDVDYCIERHIPFVRRPTGGRAILHNNEFTYSFSIRTTQGIFSRGLFDSYKEISRAFCFAFSKIGLTPEVKQLRKPHYPGSPLCFQSTSYGEVTINNKKVIGSAQKRWHDCMLQQGSIPYNIMKDEIVKVFGLKSSHESMDSFAGLKEILPWLNPDDLKSAIIIAFEETFDIKLVPLYPSQDEVFLAEEIELKKYLSRQWNFQR